VHKNMVTIQLRIMSLSDLHPLRSLQEGPGTWSRSRETTGGDGRSRGDAPVAARIAKMTIMVRK